MSSFSFPLLSLKKILVLTSTFKSQLQSVCFPVLVFVLSVSQNKMGSFTVFILYARTIQYHRNCLWYFSTVESVELSFVVYFMAINLLKFSSWFILVYF